MKELFVPRDFKPESLAIIDQANAIIAQYQADGFTLTLRQLYYQFVARALIANKHSEYKRLGSLINDGRLAGLIDWSAIEDRTRNVEFPSVWDSPEQILAAVAKQYKEDAWADQPRNVEVWIEKDALIGVVEPVCQRWRVPYFACRGNTSQSEVYAAGKRFWADAAARTRPTLVLHLGDHDPNGLDMTRDNRKRLQMFCSTPAGPIVELRRLALNMDQVEQYNPPPNPVKEADSRAAGYIEEFGDSSWELDALEPAVIDQLIDVAIADVVDRRKWDKALAAEAVERRGLQRAARMWDEVRAFVEEYGDGD